MLHFPKSVQFPCVKTAIHSSCIIGLSLAMTLPALAGYTPPKDGSAPSSGSRTSTGVRRGCVAEAGSMMILAPHSHIGQTVSTQPAVSWVIPDDEPFAMELRLYELSPNENGSLEPTTRHRTLLEKVELETTPGLMQASSPTLQTTLEPGKYYLWQVVVMCNPNRPSSALTDEVMMQVVPQPAELDTALAQATSPQDRAQVFAEAGLWYDALAQVAAAQTPEAVAYRDALLQDLAELEANSSYGQALSEHMQQLQIP